MADERLGACEHCSGQAKFRCSRCKRVKYCGKQCQKDDWSRKHKKECGDEQCVKGNSNVLDRMCNAGEASPEYVDMAVKMMEFVSMDSTYPSDMPRVVDIPPYHKEYKKVYPKERTHFLNLKENFNQQKMWGVDAYSINEHPWNEGIYLKRYGEISPELFQFLESNPKPGCIFKKHSVYPHQDSLYYTMKNVPVEEIEMERDKCYVFVAHVDIHQLLMSRITGDVGKVTFIGYELSLICVARCHLLYEMFKMACNSIHILQVWFSTGWYEKTLIDFRVACDRVLASNDISNTEVKGLIQFWRDSTISLKRATQSWFDTCSSGTATHVVGNFADRIDRVDVCRYIMTGQIFGELKSQCHGNVTMFTLPPNLLGYHLSTQSFLSTISLRNFSYNGKLFESINEEMISRVSTLIGHVRDGDVQCLFNVANVSLRKKKILAQIRSLRPHYIEWSNLPDYLHKEEFFNLAKSCGVEHTTHRVHLMNWARYVYGTFILEYHDRAKDVYDKYKKVFDTEFHSLHSQGMIPFFRKDCFIVHPWNVSDALSLEYRKHFLDYYFDVDGTDVIVGTITNESLCNFFQRSGHAFNICFTIR